MNIRIAPALPFLVIFVLLSGWVPAIGQSASGEKIVYAYYVENPANQIRIAWIAPENHPGFVQYRRDRGTGTHRKDITRSVGLPGTQFFVNEVTLSGLRGGSDYIFTVGDDSRQYKIRTLPDSLNEPIRFVTGGDMYLSSEILRVVSAHASKTEPYFAAIGGDWAYADGNPAHANRWLRFLDLWQQDMTTPDGYLVPFIPAIGNHEVTTGYSGTPENAPLYLAIFNLKDNRPYFTVDVSDYLSLIVLDSNHLTEIAGEQTRWLDRELAARVGRPHVFPIYHVPAWPSHRDFNNVYIRRVRENWVPLFEKHGVQLAFENHDHTFKRTKPIRGGMEHDQGVIYIGDGAWGVGTRQTDNSRWYLENAGPYNHFWSITLYNDSRLVEAIDRDGNTIDRFSQIIFENNVVNMPDLTGNPDKIFLGSNYPNPFNPVTQIPFIVPESADNQRVSLEIYTVQGQRVATLLNENLRAGPHLVKFDSRNHNLTSGMYIIRLQQGRDVRVRSMQLVK